MRCFRRVFILLPALAILAAMPAAWADPNCTCRYRGQSFAVNSCVCIDRGDGPRLACCEIVLNNTSWSFAAGACPTASVVDPGAVQSAKAPFTPVPALKPERR